jgi:hypothetical protein
MRVMPVPHNRRVDYAWIPAMLCFEAVDAAPRWFQAIPTKVG